VGLCAFGALWHTSRMVLYHANSFEEIAELSKQHGMEIFQKRDEAHLKAMNEMQELVQKPEAMKNWFENRKKEFETLPSD
jgi:hypothetical protein